MQPQLSVWQQIQPTVVAALQGLIPVAATAAIYWIRRRAKLNGAPSTPLPLVFQKVPVEPVGVPPPPRSPAPTEGPTLPSVAPPITSKGDGTG